MPQPPDTTACLALADGTVFYGRGFGAGFGSGARCGCTGCGLTGAGCGFAAGSSITSWACTARGFMTSRSSVVGFQLA